ncbi:alpha/beta-hydrolase [Stereum hirsutum FP-91666 SS1]|uniref:alpha/beta-hydrolase n=1 Tax=Stereum hirsutum (strain FP-91666) TaxID=721885 RepID=UPI000440FF91|nr:alpha/beta-hydrolase [Stereum hirsutum FP-91666 SS1]EIM92308.1 alpha/beta-hydrolase [Stereum hirsutum FP-91666 SS1]
MPFVEISNSNGPARVNYTISTPTNPSAPSIDPSLPTLFFIHPVYIPQQIFHLQFSNASLRRFNLVAMDSRLHGDTVGPVPKDYNRTDAARDIASVMNALQLPPCHIVGLSMGACAGLSLAMDYPQLVLSLLMLSPLPLREPQDVAEGRQEVYDCWAQAYENPNYIDEEALTDAVYGAVQLGFNNTTHGIISPLVSSAVPQATGNWRRDNLDEAYDILVGFFTKREPHCRENLMKVKCPILLIHSGADIAYPLEYLEELHASLKDANVDARITHIPNSPHFSCVTHSKQYVSLACCHRDTVRFSYMRCRQV